MARIYPDNKTTRVIFVSQAEEHFYELCRRELVTDSWQVYYSCTLSALEPGEGLRDNEIDFVLYHPKYGVLCVEVKGGRIEFDRNNGKFYTINRFDKRFEIKNPFQQVLNWKSRFLRYLRKNDIRVPVSHCVVFPNVNENDIPVTTEIEPALILGRQRLETFEKSIKELIQASQPEKFLDFADVSEELDRIIRGASFTTRLFLKDYLDVHDMRVRDVEYIHETLITPIAGARRLAVEGEAGTGKTMLAVMLAKHFKAQEKRILFLSSNPFLNQFLQMELGKEVEVMTYAELSSAYGVEILRRPTNFAGTREDWTQFEGPERLKQAIQNSSKRYDLVLCDEGQDVQPFWWESIEMVVDQTKEDSRFYVFFDRSQGVFGSGGMDSFVPEDVMPIKPPYFPLVHNYRNTREIAGFARSFRTGSQILQSHSGRLGYLPEIIVYENEQEARDKLDQLFQRLFDEEHLEAKDVTILSGRRPFHEGSVLNGVESSHGMKLVDLHDKAKTKNLDPEKTVDVCTITSFKGLETAVGIIMNLSEYNLPITNPIMASLVYVACTRAKHMLFLFVRKDDPKREALEAAARRIEYTGTMLIEGSGQADYEFAGTIVHYNPDRVGWLKVDDPAFEKSSIMFFPADITRAKITNVRVGEKLKFKPRVEGPVTIACDLKMET